MQSSYQGKEEGGKRKGKHKPFLFNLSSFLFSLLWWIA
jgi:hypothetical protein